MITSIKNKIIYILSNKTSTEIRKHYKITGIIIIVISILSIGFFVYQIGGTKEAYLHLMYIPVIFSGFLFGPKGGLVAGILGGLVLGPFMPHNVANQIPQETIIWIYRTVFFVIIGIINGGLLSFLNLHNNILHNTLNKMSNDYGQFVKTINTMVEKKDEYTGDHCKRVAYNAYLIGQELEFSQTKNHLLYWTGFLHDIGKIGIPESILLKPGKLDEKEYEVIKKHPKIGFKILKSLSKEFKQIAKGVRHHHEHWDGSGYPDGVSNNKIHEFGRIIFVVDVFEALTSNRPYREPMGKEKALNYIKENKTSYFDPEIVSIFEDLYIKNKIIIQENPRLELELPINYNLELIWNNITEFNFLDHGIIQNDFLLNIMEKQINKIKKYN